MSKLFGVKCTDEQAEEFERAAEAAAKKTVTAWLRDLGAAAAAINQQEARRAVDRAIAGEGFAAPELGPDAIVIPNRTRAADIAASIPGIRVGFDPSKLLPPADSPAAFGFLQGLARLEEGEANEQLLTRTSGEVPPKEFKMWFVDKRIRHRLAEWLDEHYPLEEK